MISYFYATGNNSDLSAGAGNTGLSLHASAVCKDYTRSGGGSGEVTWTHPAASTTLIYAEFATTAAACDFHVGDASDTMAVWLNITTANRNLYWDTCHVERLNSSGTTQQTLLALTGMGKQLTNTGQIASTPTTPTAPTLSVGDRLRVYIGIRNNTTMTQSLGITMNNLTVGIMPLNEPVWTQTDYRWRNDDGSESAATWAAAANTPVTGTVGTKRVRARVTNSGTGSTAFGWQYAKFDSPGATLLQQVGDYNNGSTTHLLTSGQLLGQSFIVRYGPAFITTLAVEPYTDIGGTAFTSGSLTVAVGDTIGGTALATCTMPYSDWTSSGGATKSYTLSTPVKVFDSGPRTLYLWIVSNSLAGGYLAGWRSGTTYADGNMYEYSGGSWNSNANQMYFYVLLYDLDWVAMPAQGTGSVPVRFANSTNLTDAGATTQQIGTGTFVAGKIYESAHTNTVTLAESSNTEFEAVVEVVSGEVAADDVLMFRVVREV